MEDNSVITPWEVTGESMQPQGEIVTPEGTLTAGENKQLQRFCRAAVLANEGFLAHRDHGWTYHGDAVDVALQRDDQRFLFVDTAGIRRKGRTDRGPEVISVVMARSRLTSLVDTPFFAFGLDFFVSLAIIWFLF